MSQNLAISSHPSTNYYHNQLPFTLPCCSRRWLSSPWFSGVSKPIRFSSLLEDAGCSPRRGTNKASHRKSISHLGKLHEGGIADKYPKGTTYSKSAKCPKGKLDLNYFSIPTIKIAPPGGFELDSNRSNTAVNQAKILFQYQKFPPLNPTTNKKIDQQKILIGFGGGAEGGGGSGGVELESNCSRIAVNCP
jgi:hypothetical protein